MSKINTQYWGANVSPAKSGDYTLSYGRSTNSIKDLIAAGKYNPNTDSFDLTVSPWGIGYSAAGNRGQIVLLRNGTRDGKAPGVFTKIMFDGMDKENTNRPFALIDRNHYFRDSFRWLQSRVGGDITVDSENYMKNAAVTYGSEYLSQNSKTDGCLSLARVATYLDYQKYKLRVTGFSYINLDTGVVAGYNFQNAFETVEQAKTRFQNFSFPEHIAIVCIRVGLMTYAGADGSPTSWSDYPYMGYAGNAIQLRGHSIGSCINFNQITATADEDTKFKLCFTWDLGVYNNSYDSDAYASIPDRYWSTDTAAQCFPVEGMNYRTGGQPTFNRILVNGLGFKTDDQYRNTNMAGNFCDKEQSFSDIKYKQRPLLYRVVNSQLTEIKKGDAVVYDTYNYYKLTSIYEVSGSDTFTKAQILALIKHEVAFYGFEFYICWGNANGGTFEVGSDDLYLPKFDKHLITTGMYTSGTASLSEPNATWGNVFGDDMPKYDSTYNPAPGGLDPLPADEDGGLINMRHYRDLVLLGSNQYYAMSGSELIQFITDINGQYADTQPMPSTTSDLEERLKQLQYSFFQKDINWKGSNPNDYIVGVYAYPFSIPHATSSTGVKVGPVTTSVTANIVETRRMLRTTYGEIKVRGSGNFLDYAPYTQLQLYLPMLGIVELDPAYYVGNMLSVDYIMDINTGSLSGIVYRNGTIDKVIEGSVAAQVPITARDMGDYQNAVQQAKQALMSSVVGGTQKGASMITGMIQTGTSAVKNNDPAAALSTYVTDLVGTGATIFSIGQNIGTSAYNLTHMSPNVSTVSTASSANSMQLEGTAVLMYRYAKFLPGYNAENYGHTVGFACCINDQIKAVEGFTVATDIDTSGIPATAEEIQMIRQAFANGVYV